MIFEYKVQIIPISTLELFLNQVEATGWQRHSVLGALSKLKSRGYHFDGVVTLSQI